MNSGGISAVCKNCSESAVALEFKMDVDAGIMVCPRCISSRRARVEAEAITKQRIEEEGNAPEPVIDEKPAGWDAEDELLEKLAHQKEKNKLDLQTIPGTNLTMCICKGCSYKFKFDPELKKPNKCPYCSVNIFQE